MAPLGGSSIKEDSSPSSRLCPEAFLLVMGITIGLAAVSITLLAAAFFMFVGPVRLTEKFLDSYTVPWWDFSYLRQPGKNAAYEMGCLSAPFLLGLAYLGAKRFVGRMSPEGIKLSLRRGGFVVLTVVVSCLVPLVYKADPKLTSMPPQWLISAPLQVFIDGSSQHPGIGVFRCFSFLAVLCLLVLLHRLGPSRKSLNRTLALLLFLLLLLLPTRIYAPSEINDEWRFALHFNALTEALAQVCNGSHLLVDFSHLYGCHPEILAPLVALLPRRLETLLFLYPALNVIGLAGWLLAARVVIRRPSILLLTGLALLGSQVLLSTEDHYYQYSAIRILFPGLGLLTAALYLREPGWSKYGLVSLLAALSPIWNLDSGMPLWAAWTAMLVVRSLSRRSLIGALIDLGRQAGFLLGMWALFFLYLRMVSGQWPDLTLLMAFQTFYMQTGYYCLGLVVPDVWTLVLLTYLTALGAISVFYFMGQASWKTHFMLMLSVLGLGLFFYFMGRSAEANLIGPSLPALLLGGILLDETGSLVRLGRLPRLTWMYLLPITMVLIWWAVLQIVSLPDLLMRGTWVITQWSHPAETPFLRNLAFVKKVTSRGEAVYFLSDHSGIYSFVSETVCPIRINGVNAMMWRKDIDHLVTAIKERKLPKLFVETNFEKHRIYRPEVYDRLRTAIAQNYIATSSGPGENLTLYVPRDGALAPKSSSPPSR